MFGISIFGINLIALLLFATILWATSLKPRNVNIVDVGWGLGFVLVAWLTWLSKVLGPQDADASSIWFRYSTLIVFMVTIWGLRLSAYLAWRSWGKAEDHRYAAMRAYRGESFAKRSLFTVFGFQAVLLWFISLTVQIGIVGSATFPWLIGVGVLIWAVGWMFETIGDWQLVQFKKDPANRGRVMDRGLWRWTRHPNYFGDFLVWWGLYMVSAQSESWWWTISGPLLMSFLLIRVSGVALLESSLSQRLDGYSDYVRRTSSFYPRRPRKSN